jgi:hypothetical protein
MGSPAVFVPDPTPPPGGMPPPAFVPDDPTPALPTPTPAPTASAAPVFVPDEPGPTPVPPPALSTIFPQTTPPPVSVAPTLSPTVAPGMPGYDPTAGGLAPWAASGPGQLAQGVTPEPSILDDTGQGLASGFVAGFQEDLRNKARIARGEAFVSDPNAPAPPTERTFANEFGYGIGGSGGMLAGGIGGAAAGTAVGGPVGGLVGAALGTGGAAVIQDLVPAYDQAIRNGKTHDQAVDYAIIHATATGAISGATAPLFAFTPFKNAIGKILFQALGAQPASGAAVRVGVPAVMGEPLPSWGEMVRGAAMDIATGGAFAGGHAIATAHLPPPVAPPVNPAIDRFARQQQAPMGQPSATDRVMVGGPARIEPGPNQPAIEITAPDNFRSPTELPTLSAQPTAELGPTQPPTVVSAEPAARSPETGSRAVEPPAAPAETTGVASLPAGVQEPAPVPPRGTVPGPEAVATAVEVPRAEPLAVPPLVPPERATIPPDDGSRTTAGRPEPAAAVGETGAARVEPAALPGVVRGEGDQGQRPGDTAGALPTETVAKTEPAQAVEPEYGTTNPHPESIAARIDQLEQLGQARTPEQTTQLTELTQQREEAQRGSPEYIAKDAQLTALNTQIGTLETQVRRAEARKGEAIIPSQRLVNQREQLNTLYQQRRDLQAERQALGETDSRQAAKTVYGAPEEPAGPIAREPAPAEALSPEMQRVMADNTAKAEQSREGGVEVVKDQLQYLAKGGASEREADQVIRRAIEAEVKRGGNAESFLDDAGISGDRRFSDAVLPKAGGATETRAGTETTGPRAETPAPAPPGPKTPVQIKIEKLQAARDSLQNKVLSPADSRRLARINTEIIRLQRNQAAIEARTAPIVADTAGTTEQVQARGGRGRQPFTGLAEPGKPLDINDYKYNNGTSVVEGVLEEAGHQPSDRNKGPAFLNKVLRDHMATKFGFGSVDVVGARGDATPVDQHRANQAMLDMTRAMTDWTAAFGLPRSGASLDGFIKRLILEPKGSRDYYGSYQPSTGEIRITGGANAFGHEWTHALDHYLTEKYTGNPRQFDDLLSKVARAGHLDTTNDVGVAFAKVINLMFYEDAAFAAKHLDLEAQAAKVDKFGNPTKGALDAQAKLDQLDAAGSKLRIQPSEFRSQSATYHPPKAGYYASVYEMLARAHEAYGAWRMETNGVDPRGVLMPDEAYINDTAQMFKTIYPQEAERAAIFAAFDEMHAALARDQALSNGQPAGSFANYGMSDPHHWPVTVPHAGGSKVARVLKAEINKLSNLTANFTKQWLFDANRPDPGNLTLGVRLADHARALTFTGHGLMETIIARSPDAAKPIFTQIMDLLAAAPGERRYTPMNFGESVRVKSREWTRRYGNMLDAQGFDLNTMTALEGEQLRHILTTGETKYNGENIPLKVINAEKNVRNLLNEAWNASDKAGLDIGYAKNGYFPRLYDQARIFSDPSGFKDAASEMHRFMFDQEIGPAGDNPEALLEKWNSLARTDKATAGANLTAEMRGLAANLRRQREIEAQLVPGSNQPASPAGVTAAQLRAELAQLKIDARDLAQSTHGAVRDHIADLAADNWLTRLITGESHDFDSTGPSGQYLNTRVLPPEADQIMAKYMHQDPNVALPHYFHAAARRISYAERFGGQGEWLTEKWKQLAHIPGVNAHDIQWFQQLVNSETGRSQVNVKDRTQQISNGINAVSSLALMPRAVWSSITEPMNAAVAFGQPKIAFKAFASQFGQLMGRATAQEHTELAEFLGITTSAMHDSIMMSRMGADYSDSPRTNRLLTAFYKTTGLTYMTNSGRTGTAVGANWFLGKLAKDFQNTDTDRLARHRKDDAQALLKEFGVPPALHDEFATWVRGLDGNIPNRTVLQSNDPMVGVYGLAMRRVVDRAYQDPYSIDRAERAKQPIVGLAFQLMSFPYQYTRNILIPMVHKIEHSYGRARTEAIDAGSSPTGATIKGVTMAGGTMAHIAAMAGAVVMAQIPTTMMRQYLFARDQWDKHEADGTLWPYIRDMAFQRSGLNGNLDPLIQLYSNLKYTADLASLLDGAGVNYIGKNALDVFRMGMSDSPNTNTRLHNGIRGLWNLTGVPLTAGGLSILGGLGGPITRGVAGPTMQYLTSPSVANKVADFVAGPKGAERPGAGPGGAKMGGVPKIPTPKMPGMPKPGGGGGSDATAAGSSGAGSVPWGFIDDFVAPIAKKIGPVIAGLPGPAKIAGLGIGAAVGLQQLWSAGEPFRGQPAPEPRATPAH